jgi:predicted DNA-binding transcriptional regulator AlpA
MKRNCANGNSATQTACSDSELLTPHEAAGLLRLSVSFLAKARMRGDGPRYRKLSRAVRYLKSDLSDWLKVCAKTSTSEGHFEGPRKDHLVPLTNMNEQE